MYIDFLLEIFKKNKPNTAIIWCDKEFSYKWLLNSITKWKNYLVEKGIDRGEIVSLIGDFSPLLSLCFLHLSKIEILLCRLQIRLI